MELGRYEHLLFEQVEKKFWQAFIQERDKTISFLDGLCQVFDLTLSFYTRREGDRLRVLDVYPEEGNVKKETLFEMDEGLKAIITKKEGYSCNTTDEGSSLEKMGIDSFLVVPLEPILDEYIFLCNRNRPAVFKEIYTSYDLFLSQALVRSISILPIKDILEKECSSFLYKTLENIYEQVSKEDKLTKETNKLRMLFDLNKELNSPGNLSEVLARGLELILKGLDSRTGYILLRDEVTEELKIIASAGKDKDKIVGINLSKDEGIEGWVIETGESLSVDSQSPLKSKTAEKAGIKTDSILVSPIKIRTINSTQPSIIGVIVVLNKPIFFREEDKGLLSSLSDTIGISIQSWMVMKNQIESIVGPYLPHLDLLIKDSSLHKVKRQKVSILFADMSGFTRMVDDLGREQEVADTLSEYFTQMSEIVFEREGIIDKFIGDGIMAIFGSAENALLSAFDMKDEFDDVLKEKFKQKWEKITSKVIEVGIRFGVATDWVFIGDLGSDKRKSYTAIGGAVNLACRLVSDADVGKVWVDAPTYNEAKNIITNSSPFESSFKGIGGKIKVYDIASIKQENPEEIYSKVEEQIKNGLIGRALINLDRLIKRPGQLGLKPLLEKAEIFENISDYKEALICYEKVLKEDSNCTQALTGKVRCLKKKGGRE
ncbi:MAG: adenylate/guanylate cyclase domain-containing protein [bacterium]|nr:adenylate/guanylate cyclase domain-containing protein [bacterium]